MSKTRLFKCISALVAAIFLTTAAFGVQASAAGVSTVKTQLKTSQIKNEAVKGSAVKAPAVSGGAAASGCNVRSGGSIFEKLFAGVKGFFTKIAQKVSNIFDKFLGIFGIGKSCKKVQSDDDQPNVSIPDKFEDKNADASADATDSAVTDSSNAADTSSACPQTSSGRITDNSAEPETTSGANESTADASATADAETPAVPPAANDQAETDTSAASSSSGVSAAGIPNRQPDATGGRAFFEKVNNMSLTNYDKAVQEEILKGNIPDFLKNFKEVKVNFKGGDGKQHTISYFVMPDYLAVGSNDDFARVPMTPMAAQAIADKFGCVLPTKKMVDDIYAAATVKLNPQPIAVSKGISKISNFYEHQKMVESQRAGKPLGELTAGNQKDVVITNLLDQAAQKGKKQVAIYGWHQKNGKPIQPLSTIHNYYHVDYSHGIRLVKNTVVVDGVERPIGEVLADKNLAAGLSAEGAIKSTKAHR